MQQWRVCSEQESACSGMNEEEGAKNDAPFTFHLAEEFIPKDLLR